MGVYLGRDEVLDGLGAEIEARFADDVSPGQLAGKRVRDADNCDVSHAVDLQDQRLQLRRRDLKRVGFFSFS